jgi:hypothetical protein
MPTEWQRRYHSVEPVDQGYSDYVTDEAPVMAWSHALAKLAADPDAPLPTIGLQRDVSG